MCSNSLPLLRLYGAQNYELSIWGVCLSQLSPIFPQRRALPSSGSQPLTSPEHSPDPCHSVSSRIVSLLSPVLFSLYLFVSVSLSSSAFSPPASPCFLGYAAAHQPLTLLLSVLVAALHTVPAFPSPPGRSQLLHCFPFDLVFFWKPSRTVAFDIAASSRAFGKVKACRICAVVPSALPFLL